MALSSFAASSRAICAGAYQLKGFDGLCDARLGIIDGSGGGFS
jgi:hypothetical protein